MKPVIVFSIVALALVAGLIAFLIYRRIRQNRRRAQWAAEPFADAWKAILTKNLPLYRRLPEPLKTQLHGIVNVLLHEKCFVGCGGQQITDEVRVTIAAQAAMLLLNRPARYFSKLKTIYVYPHTYVAKGSSFDGTVEIEGHSVRLGESWQNGPVVLTWDSVTGGARNIQDGRNVVFHEFAHQLDQEDGTADGVPILESMSCYRSWGRVLGEEYENLRKKRKTAAAPPSAITAQPIPPSSSPWPPKSSSKNPKKCTAAAQTSTTNSNNTTK